VSSSPAGLGFFLGVGEADKISHVRDTGGVPAQRGARAMHSQSAQIAQPNCSTGEPEGRAGTVLRTARPRAHDLAKRGASQRGAAGDADTLVPCTPTGL